MSVLSISNQIVGGGQARNSSGNQNIHTWPSVSVREVQDDDKELRKSSNVLLSANTSQVDLLLQRLSSWPHLLRVMSWVLRFIKRCRRETHNAVPVMTPTLSELQSASREVVRVVQRECFHEEYVALKGGGQVKSNSKLANLSPILVNDVIRVGGRIHRAPIAFEAAHPVVLPKSHPVSTLIVRYYHHILGHSGREHVLSAVRQCYWILRARSLVCQVLNKCVSCRKRNAPAKQQVMADLPAGRLVPYQPPFTYTGLDFFLTLPCETRAKPCKGVWMYFHLFQ